MKPHRLRLEKVVVNVGVGRMSADAHFEQKLLPEVMRELALITSQKPEVRRSRTSIAGFKMRQGQIVGLRVTLRRARMHDFMARFIHAVLPRVRDFRGLRLKSIDAYGNLTVGIREHVVFPEINPEQSKVSFGVEVTFVLNDPNREKAIAWYRSMGMPLQK